MRSTSLCASRPLRSLRLAAAAAAAAAPGTPGAPTAAASALRRHRLAATRSTPALRRGIQISAVPATEFPKPKPAGGDAFGEAAGAGPVGRDDADARFEVLGSPYSLLSVSLSASQILYTQRGTLVSVAGKVENATSTLSVLAPVRRALLGMPFLYQRIASTTPLTLLIGTRAATTTLFTLHLDGTTDWVVAQRRALLAWTGHTLAITPQRGGFGGGLSSRSGRDSLGLGLAHWGSSFVTGRGLVALAAPGYIYPVTLAAGEELAVHPSHVVAYAVNKAGAPQPFRFRSSASAAGAAAGNLGSKVGGAVSSVSTAVVRGLHLQTPATGVPGAGVPAAVARFWHAMRDTATYRAAARALFEARTLLRQTVWGDRLFVHVRGPATLLLSSRGVRVAEVLTREDVNEIADTEAGVVPAAVDKAMAATATQSDPAPADKDAAAAAPASSSGATAVHIATVQPGGKVEFRDAKDLSEFVR